MVHFRAKPASSRIALVKTKMTLISRRLVQVAAAAPA
jgi:hypothetical protein